MNHVPAGSRLCADCKHVSGSWLTLCARGETQVGVSPVDGSPVFGYVVLESASVQRAPGLLSFTRCGPKGRHFQPK